LLDRLNTPSISTNPCSGVRGATPRRRLPLIFETRFANGFTYLLFTPGYGGLWDPLATISVFPFVYTPPPSP
jgi:hypothetical protein